MTKNNEQIPYKYRYPLPPDPDFNGIPYSGNFEITDDFELPELDINWFFLRTPHEKWYSLNEREGYLTLKLKPETCAGKSNPSFLGWRQQRIKCSASTVLNFSAQKEYEKAGLLIFQNENHFYYLCKSTENDQPVIQLFKSAEDGTDTNPMQLLSAEILSSMDADKEIYLKIDAAGNNYSFLFGTEPGKWKILKDNVDASFLSTKTAGGFVGCVFALYATSSGNLSQNKVYYNWFNYKGDDEIYK